MTIEEIITEYDQSCNLKNVQLVMYVMYRDWSGECELTKLSSLLATMEAKRLSPARSEMRNKYSGALT